MHRIRLTACKEHQYLRTFFASYVQSSKEALSELKETISKVNYAEFSESCSCFEDLVQVLQPFLILWNLDPRLTRFANMSRHSFRPAYIGGLWTTGLVTCLVIPSGQHPSGQHTSGTPVCVDAAFSSLFYFFALSTCACSFEVTCTVTSVSLPSIGTPQKNLKKPQKIQIFHLAPIL